MAMAGGHEDWARVGSVKVMGHVVSGVLAMGKGDRDCALRRVFVERGEGCVFEALAR